MKIKQLLACRVLSVFLISFPCTLYAASGCSTQCSKSRYTDPCSYQPQHITPALVGINYIYTPGPAQKCLLRLADRECHNFCTGNSTADISDPVPCYLGTYTLYHGLQPEYDWISQIGFLGSYWFKSTIDYAPGKYYTFPGYVINLEKLMMFDLGNHYQFHSRLSHRFQHSAPLEEVILARFTGRQNALRDVLGPTLAPVFYTGFRSGDQRDYYVDGEAYLSSGNSNLLSEAIKLALDSPETLIPFIKVRRSAPEQEYSGFYNPAAGAEPYTQFILARSGAGIRLGLQQQDNTLIFVLAPDYLENPDRQQRASSEMGSGDCTMFHCRSEHPLDLLETGSKLHDSITLQVSDEADSINLKPTKAKVSHALVGLSPDGVRPVIQHQGVALHLSGNLFIQDIHLTSKTSAIFELDKNSVLTDRNTYWDTVFFPPSTTSPKMTKEQALHFSIRSQFSKDTNLTLFSSGYGSPCVLGFFDEQSERRMAEVNQTVYMNYRSNCDPEVVKLLRLNLLHPNIIGSGGANQKTADKSVHLETAFSRKQYMFDGGEQLIQVEPVRSYTSYSACQKTDSIYTVDSSCVQSRTICPASVTSTSSLPSSTASQAITSSNYLSASVEPSSVESSVSPGHSAASVAYAPSLMTFMIIAALLH